MVGEMISTDIASYCVLNKVWYTHAFIKCIFKDLAFFNFL